MEPKTNRRHLRGCLRDARARETGCARLSRVRDRRPRIEGGIRCAPLEIAHGRVRRIKRGRYGPLWMPRATEYRIHRRALALREEAAALVAKDSAAFWDAFDGLAKN